MSLTIFAFLKVIFRRCQGQMSIAIYSKNKYQAFTIKFEIDYKKFSQCLEITSNIYIPLFLKAKFCLRSNFWKAVLCCHEGYTFSGIYHGLRIMLLILRTTNFVRI